MQKIIYKIIYTFLKKEVGEMAVIYATLIAKGKKVFANVPERLKEQVKQILIDLELEDLAK